MSIGGGIVLAAPWAAVIVLAVTHAPPSVTVVIAFLAAGVSVVIMAGVPR